MKSRLQRWILIGEALLLALIALGFLWFYSSETKTTAKFKPVTAATTKATTPKPIKVTPTPSRTQINVDVSTPAGTRLKVNVDEGTLVTPTPAPAPTAAVPAPVPAPVSTPAPSATAPVPTPPAPVPQSFTAPVVLLGQPQAYYNSWGWWLVDPNGGFHCPPVANSTTWTGGMKVLVQRPDGVTYDAWAPACYR